jgi:hypothetical protein
MRRFYCFIKQEGSMTSSELKRRHLSAVPDSHFFDRKTMQFFGDSMRNFGVRSLDDGLLELYRRHPVKHGLQASHYFDAQTYKEAL